MEDRLQHLEELVRILRGPDGCPWDREQELGDLRAYLIEEAHEVAAAIDAADSEGLKAELGDLLFQIVFAARLAEESGHFDLGKIIDHVRRKMIRRHPHVFGEEEVSDSEEVRAAWEKRKLERREGSMLANTPSTLPALVGAYRISQKVAAVGFDWPDVSAILGKIEEELNELRIEIGNGNDVATRNRAAIRAEIGDLLFTVANLSRRLEVDPEASLSAANAKFRRRFEAVEKKLVRRGGRLGRATIQELDELWTEVKREET